MSDTVGSAKESQWRERLRRFQSSGLSVTRFCERERVSAPAFYLWRKRLGVPRAEARSAGSTASGFLPVRLVQAAAVDIQLPNGARVSVPAGMADALQVAIEAVGRLPGTPVAAEADPC